MKKLIIPSVLIVIVAASIFFVVNFSSSGDESSGIKAIVYKSIACGCCSNYVSYLKSKDFSVETKQTENMGAIKNNYNIPSSMESCHTTVIGDYFIEGHMPVEAIEKLLKEKPAIKGIALPGMPSASPGMPGSKMGKFEIFAVSSDGKTTPFMSI